MPWPSWWSSPKQDEDKTTIQKAEEAVESVLSAANVSSTSTTRKASSSIPRELQAFTEPRTVVATLVLTTAFIGFFKFYRSFLRRIPEAGNISSAFLRKRSIFGKVTSVGDGDNFRIYHTPGGWIAGWGWLPWRRVPKDRKELKNKTVRGPDWIYEAPADPFILRFTFELRESMLQELAHFGRPSQPYAQDALDWLTAYVAGRRVRAYVYKLDQYSRVVATVYVRKGIFRRDIGLQMLRAGWATVYEAKTGAEFGEGLEEKYRKAEWWAQTKRKGMWAGDKKDFESPREYKTRHGSGSPV